MVSSSLYVADFSTWLNQQVLALKHRNESALDWDNLAQELTMMGISERTELKNCLIVLLVHLLKWQYQPNKRSASWFTTVANQRDDLQDLLIESPGLRQYIPTILAKAYRNARREASSETGLGLSSFEDSCPYDIDQVLSNKFVCDTTKDFEKAMEKETG
ncbi:MAG: DUF29 domain-containing protein [Microcystaceae cyanobacterium]